MALDDTHIQDIAEAAGKKAAREVLILLGVDATTPAGIQRAQRNFAFLDDLRMGTTAIKHKVWLSLIGAIFTAAAAFLTLWIRSWH